MIAVDQNQVQTPPPGTEPLLVPDICLYENIRPSDWQTTFALTFAAYRNQPNRLNISCAVEDERGSVPHNRIFLFSLSFHGYGCVGCSFHFSSFPPGFRAILAHPSSRRGHDHQCATAGAFCQRISKPMCMVLHRSILDRMLRMNGISSLPLGNGILSKKRLFQRCPRATGH
jgi:hypothetical protein